MNIDSTLHATCGIGVYIYCIIEVFQQPIGCPRPHFQRQPQVSELAPGHIVHESQGQDSDLGLSWAPRPQLLKQVHMSRWPWFETTYKPSGLGQVTEPL